MSVAIGILLMFAAEPVRQGSVWAEVDQAFVCPEALPDENARMAALKQYLAQASTVESGKTLFSLMLHRRVLLENHNCRKSISNIKYARSAINAGSVLKQDWIMVGGNSSVRISISVIGTEPYVDPHYSDDHAVMTYVDVKLSSPDKISSMPKTYDELVSHEIFYCNFNKNSLIENDYFRSGTLIFRDIRPGVRYGKNRVYVSVPTDSGTVNALVARTVCSA